MTRTRPAGAIRAHPANHATVLAGNRYYQRAEECDRTHQTRQGNSRLPQAFFARRVDQSSSSLRA